MWRDLQYGAKILLKRPGFTLIAIMTLALGIAANSAILSVVNGVLVRPLPFDGAERLVRVYVTTLDKSLRNNPASWLNFSDWRAQAASGLICACLVLPWL